MEEKTTAANGLIDMKSSKFGETKVGASILLTSKEPLTYQNCEELEGAFKDLMNRHENKIILNLKAVPFLDSKALELLVRIHEKLSKRLGALKIVGMDAVCQDIFYATRLINFFHIYKDFNEAIKCGP
jgi:anti-anti-sigma factor